MTTATDIALTGNAVAESVAVADSLATDTIPVTYGMVLESTGHEAPAPASHGIGAGSWLIAALFLLFFVICLRLRGSNKYLSVLVKDLVEVRERHNAFDDTVRETSLLVLLNILWSFCAGVMLYLALPGTPDSLHTLHSAGLWICVGVALAYTAVMTLAYMTVGIIFSDRVHARMWVKGFAAAQGLETAVFFPLALAALCYTEIIPGLLTAAAITFATGKIIFICKGFRIFFVQFSSWILFLYYLCSLEIVPLILTYLLASELCSKF